MQKEWEIAEKAQSLYGGFTKRFMFEKYLKKIDAFLKLNNLPSSKEDEYFKKYTEEEFDTLIKKFYTIKGDITPQSILKAKKKTEKKETEHDIQVKVCKYLAKLQIKHFAVPNGFVRGDNDKLTSARYVNYMKAEGLRNGAPDLVLLPGDGKVCFLEMKTPTGTLSEYQKDWQGFFMNNKYVYKVAYGFEDAKKFIDTLL